jgi:hypothetical protein
LPIDPNIALQVHAPQIESPVETYGKVLSLRDLLQTGQMNQLKIQAEQIKNREAANALQDQETVRQSYLTNSGDLDKVIKDTAGRVSPATTHSLQQNQIDIQTKLGAYKQQQLALMQTQNGMLAGSAQAILSAPPEQHAARYAEERAKHIQQGLITPDQAPEQYPGDDQMRFTVANLASADTQIKRALEAKEAEQKTAESAANVKKAQAEAGHLEAQTQELQAGIKAWNDFAANPNKVIGQGGEIDQTINDPNIRARTKAAVAGLANAPGTPTAKTQAYTAIMTQARQQDAELAKLTDPRLRQAAISQKVAEENALIPAKTAQAVATRRALYGSAATANVPPELIPKYTGEIEKIANSYADAVDSDNEMANLIDLVRKGNKAAYAYEPVAGVMTINAGKGNRRINLHEIMAYSGAGSAADKVRGFLGKQLSGKSIPSDIVDAMAEMHSTLGKNAHVTASNKINQTNRLYGGTLKPEELLIGPEAPAKPKGPWDKY